MELWEKMQLTLNLRTGLQTERSYGAKLLNHLYLFNLPKLVLSLSKDHGSNKKNRTLPRGCDKLTNHPVKVT